MASAGNVPPRLGVIRAELARFERPRYLEIGIFDGAIFLEVEAAEKVAVDPVIRIPRFRRLLRSHRRAERFLEIPSDEYFEALDRDALFDVVFVDGLHLREQALRDIENSLRHLADGGVVLVHDCNPPDEAVASRDQEAARRAGYRAWCGDVWKAIVELRSERADLQVEVLDTDYGIGVVRRGASEPLGLSEEELRGLSYADLEADRQRLLGLRAP